MTREQEVLSKIIGDNRIYTQVLEAMIQVYRAGVADGTKEENEACAKLAADPDYSAHSRFSVAELIRQRGTR